MSILEFLLLCLFAPFFAVVLVAFRALFIVPLWGSLVRYRANFTPKGLGLDEEGGAGGGTRVGPVVTSLWGMILRVKELEGWAGLYKGIYPYILSHTLSFSILIIFLGASTSLLPSGTPQVPNPSGLRTAMVAMVVTFVSLPLLIITNRAITTPYILPTQGGPRALFANAKTALSVLLTPHEREKPWVLWLTPGLLASTAIYIVWTVFVMRVIRELFLPGWGSAEDLIVPVDGEDMESNNPSMTLTFSTFRYVMFFTFQALSTLLLTPLEVISTRLSLQRTHAPDSTLTTTAQEAADAGGLEYFSEGEDVVGFRSEDEPYAGLVDCARKMMEEEGAWEVWSRGWWVTMGANLGRGFP